MARAKAPSSARVDRAMKAAETGDDSASRTIRFEYRGRVYELTEDAIGPADDFISRAQTSAWFKVQGVPHEGYAITHLMANLTGEPGAHVGTDILLVLLWMARRKNGEPGLTFAQALEDAGSAVQLINDFQVNEGDAAGEAQPADSPESLPTSGQSSRSVSDSTPETS